jgi:hypothetical protein
MPVSTLSPGAEVSGNTRSPMLGIGLIDVQAITESDAGYPPDRSNCKAFTIRDGVASVGVVRESPALDGEE